jgi:two-component system LytT family response regulator
MLNLDRLARVETDERDNRVAILADGRRLPISRTGYSRLSALLK